MSAFEEACPLYLLYGMTYEQYWDGDVSAHRTFRKADQLRIKRQNEMAWIQGAYIYEALCNSASLFRGMKPTRPQKYRSEPYDLSEEDKQKREEKEARARYDMMRSKVEAFAKAFNEKQQTKEVSKDGGT